ncbi:MAG: hypothetical protein ABIU58_10230 [Ramlibacter sp.]
MLALTFPTGGFLHRHGVERHPQGVAQPAPVRVPIPVPVRLADFGQTQPSDDVRQLANWAVFTRDHKDLSMIFVDKKDAKVYVLDHLGRLQGAAPVLLGSAIGDDTVPGIGDKPIAQVLPEERTTPAGRFIAEPGMNARGEDVVWVDYDAAVSMHRVLTTDPKEQRLERMASPNAQDHRISYGCINVPRAFFEQWLAPTVRQGGAVIYVLPEIRSMQQVFGSFDVESPSRMAQR